MQMFVRQEYKEKSRKILQKIENDLGRVRKKKWDERIIDLDILLFNDQIINTTYLLIQAKRDQ